MTTADFWDVSRMTVGIFNFLYLIYFVGNCLERSKLVAVVKVHFVVKRNKCAQVENERKASAGFIRLVYVRLK